MVNFPGGVLYSSSTFALGIAAASFANGSGERERDGERGTGTGIGSGSGTEFGERGGDGASKDTAESPTA